MHKVTRGEETGNVAWVVVATGKNICWINECKESKAIAKHVERELKNDPRVMRGEMKKWMQDVHGGPNKTFKKSVKVYVFMYV